MAEDLRGWLDKIKDKKELKVINGADWNLEIGGITQLNWKTRQNPALLFDNIKGYPPGYRILTSSTATPGRIAFTFGLKYSGEYQLLDLVFQKIPQWLAEREKFNPVVVNTGPVMETVQL